MKKITYSIRKDMIKTDASLAKFFLFGGGIVLLLTGIVFIYSRFIQSEPLTFYKNIDDCKVTVDYKTTHTRYRGKTKTHRDYYVYVKTPDGADNVSMKVSKSYYNEMSKFVGLKNVTLSFFKTESGKLFPSYTPGASAGKAGHQYVECYPSAAMNIILIIMGGAGVVFVSVGLAALRTYRRKNYELHNEVAASGIEQGQVSNDMLMQEFDKAMENDPYKLSRSPSSSRQTAQQQAEKRVSASQRDELLRQFDELTADGKYKYKTHD